MRHKEEILRFRSFDDIKSLWHFVFFNNYFVRSKMVVYVVLCYISYICAAVVVGVDVSMELEMT